MMAPQAKRPLASPKASAPVTRPAGMQAIDVTLYQRIRDAVRELSAAPAPTPPRA